MPTKRRQAHPLLKAATIAKTKPVARPHRLNPRAVRHGIALGDLVGMTQIGIHLVRIKPGDQTTEYHTHYCDEEFLYILSGRGTTEIGDKKFTVGPGDFMGFTAKSLPHAMANPFKEDLVYLMGGTRKPFDVSEYPRLKKRTYKFCGERHTVLYRNAQGHGKLYCAACHGSPHAIVPSREASDNAQALQYQGFTGVVKSLGSCGVCHKSSRGQEAQIAEFAKTHGGTKPKKTNACHVCHTVVPVDRTKWPHGYQWKNSK